MRSTLASLVDDFRRHGDETAVVAHRGVRSYRTTYAELASLAGRFAAELELRGIGPGDRVLLWGENSAEWIAAFFGCLLRGVLAVPLDAAGSPEFAARILREVSPRLVIIDRERIEAASDVPQLRFSELGEVLPARPDFRIDPAVQEEAPFQIIFTSGTTSEPKGIVHTHRNVLASLGPMETEIAKYRRYERWVHPLRFLHTLPLSHVFGQFMGLWIPGVLGAEIHFTNDLESARLIRLIRRNRVSVLIAVPRVLSLLRTHLLASHPALEGDIERVKDLPVLKRWWHLRDLHRALGWRFWAIISGGATLPSDLETFWNRLGLALIQGYGMTETAALVTLNHPFRISRGTIGKPLPGREVRLSDTGELLVRGGMVASSTWQAGELHRREEEWLATGDLVEQTEAGDLRFVGRKGDVIVTSNGLNIHPSDLESAVLRQQGVQACAVVPCDFSVGSEPVCVVLYQGDEAALQTAIDEANRELSAAQQIRRALRWPGIAFPYTSTGKLLRRSIRDWACAAIQGRDIPRAHSDDSLLGMVSSITGERWPGEASDELRLSEDLHLDSLGRVQLAGAIEQRTGASIDDEQMAALRTLGDLRRALSADATPVTRTAVQTIEDAAAPSLTPALAVETVSNRHSPKPHSTYPRWPWTWPVRLLRVAFVEAILRPLVGLLLAPRVVGAEISDRGPLLVIANHVLSLDGALVLYALPPALRRDVAIMMSGEMLADFRAGQIHGVAGRAAYWLLTALFNVFPLPRLRGFRESFAHAGEAIDTGNSVLIFPEGTRSRTGQMAPFRRGIGLLASQAGVPVLPVALIGLEDIRARGARWFRSGRLEIRMGTTIPWDESRPAAEWTSQLEEALRKLRGQRD